MKCDELKYENLGDMMPFYPRSTLVIRKQFVDAAIAELKAENERLEKCCNEYDSRQRIDERIKFNGAKQLRATKRALWLARAERAHLKVLEYWPDYCHNAHCRIAEQKWDKVERKCRAMAEEYK